MSQKKYTATVLSTTHWDRAWYLPFQVYRVRLVRLVDRLIDLLDNEDAFHSFMLDGQMAPVEDYLAIRPNQKQNLIRLVNSGKLFVGPWYVLADEYLVSPESLIRNLMLGMRMAGEYGDIMSEGYTPDSFGHIAQLPQILGGFGIESCIFWRGFGDEADELGNEFYWEAPDGTRVLAVHIRDGYHNIANVGYPNRGSDRSFMALDWPLAMEQVQAAADLLKPGATTSHMLFFDGVDHAEANHDITAVIARANERLEETELVHGTLPDYIAGVRNELGDRQLPSYTGEFNRGKLAHVLQSVYSTRIYLKQANDKAQRLLEQYAEPIGAFAWALGDDYPDALLWEAWKLLLRNHPHDDICGCSCDEVHQEDVQRFSEVDQIGRILTRDSFRSLMAHIPCNEQSGIPVVVFNPAGWSRSDCVEVMVPFDQNDDTPHYHLVGADGAAPAQAVVDVHNYFEAELRKNHYQRRTTYAVQLDDMPSCGYQVLYARPGQLEDGAALVTHSAHGMENAAMAVAFNFDGTFDLTDKATGKTYSGLGRFEDEEDAGDEYDYSPCPNTLKLTTDSAETSVKLISKSGMHATWQIEHTWQLPVSLTDDRQQRSRETVTCHIVSEVTLRGNNRQVDVKTTIDNTAKDHRLRACFPTDIVTDVATADGHFSVETRAIDQPEKPDWVQPPVPTKHQRTFVDVSDGEFGLTILNRGLPEYEIMRDGGRNTVAVTLLRCVDMLFRDDLITRPGYAWLPLHTPDAQCLGTHTFEYAVAPHAGDWRNIYADAQTWASPIYSRRGDETEGFVPVQSVPKDVDAYQLFNTTQPIPVDLGGSLPSQQSFVSVSPSTVVLSTVKRSEDGKMLVVRVFNMGDEVVSAEINCFRPVHAAYQLTMNEDRQHPIPTLQAVEIKPRQVLTLGLEIERAEPKPLRRLG